MRKKATITLTWADAHCIYRWINAHHSWDFNPVSELFYVPDVGWVPMATLQAVKLGNFVLSHVPPDDDDGDPSDYGG